VRISIIIHEAARERTGAENRSLATPIHQVIPESPTRRARGRTARRAVAVDPHHAPALCARTA
jgi:hypothetical protein